MNCYSFKRTKRQQYMHLPTTKGHRSKQTPQRWLSTDQKGVSWSCFVWLINEILFAYFISHLCLKNYNKRQLQEPAVTSFCTRHLSSSLIASVMRGILKAGAAVTIEPSIRATASAGLRLSYKYWYDMILYL